MSLESFQQGYWNWCVRNNQLSQAMELRNPSQEEIQRMMEWNKKQLPVEYVSHADERRLLFQDNWKQIQELIRTDTQGQGFYLCFPVALLCGFDWFQSKVMNCKMDWQLLYAILRAKLSKGESTIGSDFSELVANECETDEVFVEPAELPERIQNTLSNQKFLLIQAPIFAPYISSGKVGHYLAVVGAREVWLGQEDYNVLYTVGGMLSPYGISDPYAVVAQKKLLKYVSNVEFSNKTDVTRDSGKISTIAVEHKGLTPHEAQVSDHEIRMSMNTVG